ncbi:MAG: hypothetical protein KDJ48_01140, partial [Nitratireductor sp.]|nr:hypothetical protein [Nitratireductor sp.]
VLAHAAIDLVFCVDTLAHCISLQRVRDRRSHNGSRKRTLLCRSFSPADRNRHARFAACFTGYVKKEPGQNGPELALD